MFSSGEEKYSSADVVCDEYHGSVIFSWVPTVPSGSARVENCVHCEECPCEKLKQSGYYNPDGGEANLRDWTS